MNALCCCLRILKQNKSKCVCIFKKYNTHGIIRTYRIVEVCFVCSTYSRTQQLCCQLSVATSQSRDHVTDSLVQVPVLLSK